MKPDYLREIQKLQDDLEEDRRAYVKQYQEMVCLAKWLIAENDWHSIRNNSLNYETGYDEGWHDGYRQAILDNDRVW